ncbi:MAG: phosphatase PAP2 family protein [Actinomycetota bacterium]
MNLGELVAVADPFDEAVDRVLDRVRGGPADRVAYALSEAANHSILWHVLGTISASLPGGGGRRAITEQSVVLGIESALVNGPVKSAFRRPRPEGRDHAHQLRQPKTSSFPSGHATSAFTAAALLTRRRPGLRPAWYVLAAAVASTRAWVGIHHASDVIGGVLVGLGLGKLATSILHRLDA